MIRAWLRAGLVKWAFGTDPAPLLKSLRRAVAAVKSARAEHHALNERVERLKRAVVGVADPLGGGEVGDRAWNVEPYLDTVGVPVCSEKGAPESNVRQKGPLSVDPDAAPDTVVCC